MMRRFILLLLSGLCVQSAVSQIIYFKRSIWGKNTDLGFNSFIQLDSNSSNLAMGNPVFEAVNETASVNAQLLLRTYSGSAGGPAPSYVNSWSARGTIASPLPSGAGDTFLVIQSVGYNSVNPIPGAQIVTRADSDWSGSNSATRMEFYVTPTNGNIAESMRLDPAGNLVVSSNSITNANFGGFGGNGIQIRENVTASLSLSGGRNYIIGSDNLSRLDIWDDGVGAYRLIMDPSGGFTIGFSLASDIDSGANGIFRAKRLAVTTDTSNASYLELRTNSPFSNVIDSNTTGAGTLLPIAIAMGGIEQARFDTSGALLLGTTTASDKLVVNGIVNSLSGYKANGTSGLSVTTTVRNSAGTGTCTLIYSFGIRTGGTC